MKPQYSCKVPNTLLESHECEALLIACMDFRFREATQKFMKEGLGIKEFDLVSLPGAGKGTAEGEKTGEVNAFSVEIAQRLHRIKQAVVVHHSRCGAYGIPDAEEELDKQSEDLRKVHSILSEQFPKLAIQSFFAQGGDGDIRYIEIK